MLALLPPAEHAGAQAPVGLARSRDLRGGAGPAAVARPAGARARAGRRWRARPRRAAPSSSRRSTDVHDAHRGRWRARAASTTRSRSRSRSVGSTPSTARSTSTCWPSSSLALTWVGPRRWIVRLAWVLVLAAASALHVAGIVIRCVLRERPPISTLYETDALHRRRRRGRLPGRRAHPAPRRRAGAGAGPGRARALRRQRFEELKGEDTMPQLVAVLDTNFWLATHVTCITIGYAGGLLAAARGARLRARPRPGLGKRDDPAFYALLTRMTYGDAGLRAALLGRRHDPRRHLGQRVLGPLLGLGPQGERRADDLPRAARHPARAHGRATSSPSGIAAGHDRSAAAWSRSRGGA